MKTIFLSYSRFDYFFAEMLAIKLKKAGFSIWRDQGAIRAGDDWRQTIVEGIKDCTAVVVALSTNSAESEYVTFEWAYARGMGKSVVPVKLSDCKFHPQLEPNQYIDFSYPNALPWGDLIKRLKQVDEEAEAPVERPVAGKKPSEASEPDALASAADEVLSYLNSHGFAMASFERLRQQISTHPTNEMFEELIASKPRLFRRVFIKGGKLGIAKQVP